MSRGGKQLDEIKYLQEDATLLRNIKSEIISNKI